MFTYRSDKSGITSKSDLARINPMLAGIRPMTEGRMFVPQPLYYQSAGEFGEVIREMAAIIHPELFPKHQLRYFIQLKDR